MKLMQLTTGALLLTWINLKSSMVYTDPALFSLTMNENLMISNSKLTSDSEFIW